jgi:SAM-dependent methyltransferase
MNSRHPALGLWAWLARRFSDPHDVTEPSGTTQVQRLEWTPELVDRFWAGFAQTRLTEYSFSRLGGRSLVLAVEHHLPHDGTILDYGAGDGELVGLLLDRGYKVAAYEPSGKRNERLTDRVSGREGFLGLVGLQAKEQFDVVLMVEVIEHILDGELDGALRRLYRFLKKGGTLIVTTPNKEDLELGMAYCPVSDTLFHRWQHVRSFTAESLSALLKRHRFTPIVVHQLEFRPELFVPFDQRWAGDQFVAESPAYFKDLRTDTPVEIGNASNLLFIGRKV